jgi:hypothetical protein
VLEDPENIEAIMIHILFLCVCVIMDSYRVWLGRQQITLIYGANSSLLLVVLVGVIQCGAISCGCKSFRCSK